VISVAKTSKDVMSDSEADDFEMIDVEVWSSDEELDGDEEMLDAEDDLSAPENTENPMAIAVEEQTTLFIRNLSFESTEEDLSEKYGLSIFYLRI
jgi:RNA recognition motif-containing protein